MATTDDRESGFLSYYVISCFSCKLMAGDNTGFLSFGYEANMK